MDRPGNEMMTYLAEHESLRQYLADLKWALFEEAERLSGNPSLGRPQVVQEVDRFLSLFASGSKGSEAALEFKPRLGPHFAD
jgi:hypothetical protein